MSALNDIMPDLSSYGGRSAVANAAFERARTAPRVLKPAELSELVVSSSLCLLATGVLFGLLTLDLPFDLAVVRWSSNDNGFGAAARGNAFGYYNTILNSNLVVVPVVLVTLYTVNALPHRMRHTVELVERPAVAAHLRWIQMFYFFATGIYACVILPKYFPFVNFGSFVHISYDPAMFEDWWMVVAARAVIVPLLIFNCRWWFHTLVMLLESLGGFRKLA